jgi:hypothetical protein
MKSGSPPRIFFLKFGGNNLARNPTSFIERAEKGMSSRYNDEINTVKGHLTDEEEK